MKQCDDLTWNDPTLKHARQGPGTLFWGGVEDSSVGQ